MYGDKYESVVENSNTDKHISSSRYKSNESNDYSIETVTLSRLIENSNRKTMAI